MPRWSPEFSLDIWADKYIERAQFYFFEEIFTELRFEPAQLRQKVTNLRNNGCCILWFKPKLLGFVAYFSHVSFPLTFKLSQAPGTLVERAQFSQKTPDQPCCQHTELVLEQINAVLQSCTKKYKRILSLMHEIDIEFNFLKFANRIVPGDPWWIKSLGMFELRTMLAVSLHQSFHSLQTSQIIGMQFVCSPDLLHLVRV